MEDVVVETIYELNSEGERIQKVQNIEDQILQEVIKAALNWKFRPAQKNGEPVRSYTKNLFTI